MEWNGTPRKHGSRAVEEQTIYFHSSYVHVTIHQVPKDLCPSLRDNVLFFFACLALKAYFSLTYVLDESRVLRHSLCLYYTMGKKGVVFAFSGKTFSKRT